MGKSARLQQAASEGEGEGPPAGEYRVLLLATLITTTRELPVKLRSLSATGAAIEGFNLPAAGTDVILKRGGLDAFATVVHAEGRRCMLRFETVLDEAEIRAQIRYPRPSPEPVSVDPTDHRRPGFHGGAFTDEDRRTVSEWARPVGRLAFRD